MTPETTILEPARHDDAGARDLLCRAGVIEHRVRLLVEARRAADPNPDDPFRGLYLSDEVVDQLLSASSAIGSVAPPKQAEPPKADAETPRDGAPRLQQLAIGAGLTERDIDFLLIAVLPDLDSRFERLYGYLNDDVTRRRASIGLALELAGTVATSAAARARLAPGCPLVDEGLLVVEDAERPFLTRALHVPDRVTAHLLGDDTPDASLASVLVDVQPYDCDVAAAVARALRAGRRLVYLRERGPVTAAATLVAALSRAGRAAVAVDLVRVLHEPNRAEVLASVGREALLRNAGVVAGPVDAVTAQAPELLRRLTRLSVPVLLVGSESWDPGWSRDVPAIADAPDLGPRERAALWHDELGVDAQNTDAGSATRHFVLGPAQVARAVEAARTEAAMTGEALSDELLRRGARAQNAAGLERLARRIEPQVTWADLVLPRAVLVQLHDLATRARNRDRVLTEWRMRPGGGRGRGITALFAGDSGTGKTMSAEVIAAALGLDLYTVDLATVVDKYIGETEKNLERIFREAAGVNAVLLFDEADAIFGKRSEVRDAHDRYANIESAYLLQRMESFDGLVILASNIKSNIDEAFTRRLDAIVDFPTPDELMRRALWQRCLAPPLPVDDDVDLDFCARSFELSGGNIRSIAITAAYLAAASTGQVSMRDVIAAVHQEYRKLGRLVLEREFGPYLQVAR